MGALAIEITKDFKWNGRTISFERCDSILDDSWFSYNYQKGDVHLSIETHKKHWYAEITIETLGKDRLIFEAMGPNRKTPQGALNALIIHIDKMRARL